MSSSPPPRPADVQFAAGDLAAAASGYEELLRRRPELATDDPELVERLALARAVPGHEGSDPARARELLGRLRGGPGSDGVATAVLALLDELDRLTGTVKGLENGAAIDAERLRRCAAEATACDHLVAEERRLGTELEVEMRILEERLEAVERERDQLQLRLRQLSEDLEALKSIDLGRRP